MIKKTIILLAVFSFALLSCNDKIKITPKDSPIVVTNEIEIISDTGIVATASIVSNDNFNIIEYGFVWSQSPSLLLSDFKESSNNIDLNGNYSIAINKELFKNKSYSIRAYCITDNKNIYGNIVTFTSNGSVNPQIFSITPTFGTIGDKVVIYGKNFSEKEENIELLFGNKIIDIDSCSPTKIYFTIPYVYKNGAYEISLNVLGKTVFETFEVILEWTQKEDFEGSGRAGAVAFSIGNKGYLGTGYDSNGNKNDFWEYNPDNDTWSQKADFGGTKRYFAVGFSIGNKGYIGTGYDTGTTKDFWEYSPISNQWLQKSDFSGSARYSAVGFSIDGKGYIGTGNGYSVGNMNDFWEYNPDTDTWSQKEDFGGTKRNNAVGFSIGDKGYIGTGNDGSYKNDFWEYNPLTNQWKQKANFIGSARKSAVGFSIGDKGYIGIGNNGYSINDFWEYNPNYDYWFPKPYFVGTARYDAVSFPIGDKAYVGTGNDDSHQYKKDFWEFYPIENQIKLQK